MEENGIAPLTWEGKRSAAAAPDAEVVDKPTRRRFSPSYKLRVVEEADRCTEPGEVGRLLRREGLYSSHLTTWRKAVRSGWLRALSKRRGRKPSERNPLEGKVRKLERENTRLFYTPIDPTSDAGGLALNGDVVTGTAGLDRQWRAVLVGLALSRSSGEGGYGTGAGTIASTLTSVHPYVQVRLGERAQVWGAAGWGRGGLEITPESGAALEADLRNSMAAAGARAVLMGAGGLEIALRSDFLWTETSSDGTAALAEAVGTASRGRLMLEGAGQIQGLGGVVRPKVEGGVRYDGGDAETGRGFEVGGGLDWARGSLTLQVNGRMLIAHADESYEEWGYSGSLVYEPGADGLGLQMRVGSSAGAAASGIRNLWALENASGLVRGGGMPFAQRFDAEVGYGIGRGALWYPYFVADDSGQTRYGLKLSSGRTIGVGLEFGRRKSVDLGPEDAMLLRGELRF